jgi:hypothetical protein
LSGRRRTPAANNTAPALLFEPKKKTMPSSIRTTTYNTLSMCNSQPFAFFLAWCGVVWCVGAAGKSPTNHQQNKRGAPKNAAPGPRAGDKADKISLSLLVAVFSRSKTGGCGM